MEENMTLLRRKNDSQEVQIQEIDERHNLSQQVFFRREAAGWSQKELADRCDTTQAQIANIEAGRVNVTLNTMVKLACAFGCLAHDLLRPLENEEEWERPDARDWARWTQEKDRQSGGQRKAALPLTEVTGVAMYYGEANAGLALTT